MNIYLLILGIFAQASPAADKNQIWDLLARIDSELRLYDQQPRQLEQAKVRLEEALRILRQGEGANPNNCLTFATEEYVKDGYSNSAAMQKSKALCNQINRDGTSLEIVQFIHSVLKQDGYSTAASLQLSADIGKGVQERSLECIQPAFERYQKDGFSGRASINKAVEFCKP